jgi:Ca-activated chloride channel family protein
MANQGMTIHGITIQRITISNLVLMVILSIIVFYAFGERSLDEHAPEKAMNDLPGPEQPGPGPASLDHVRLDQISEGSLVFDDTQTGAWLKAPTVDTSVDMKITGMIAHVTVKQKFSNPTSIWQNGIYIFPLPDLAAVDRLKMIVGERVIEGQIKERQEAKQVYREARSSGRKASLVEQERPNIFTNSIANIGPGEQIAVEISYQQTLTYDQGSFSIRFPMVVAPRYIPGQRTVTGFDGSGWATNTDAVLDAKRITPGVEDSRKRSKQNDPNRVRINVNLHTGFSLATLQSPYHRIKKTNLPDHHYLVELDTSVVSANRDFELRWSPRLSETPQAALFTEMLGEEKYGLLMVVPPNDDVDRSSLLSREIIFVIDTSGSMHGASLAQAKAAVVSALERLDPDDLFNVVQFNSNTYAMSFEPVRASKANIDNARGYVYALRANGGTEIRGALERVLMHPEGRSGDQGKRLRQVIFLTDGSVGNEDALLTLINEHLGDTRLFTIGIGSAPNSFFMREAATAGHGTFTYIGDISEVQRKMSTLLQKLERPVLTNINIAWSRGSLTAATVATDFWPNPLRDLYLGEPLVVSIRIPKQQSHLEITGIRMDRDWSMRLPIKAGGLASGLNLVWARNKIRSLMSLQRKRGISKQDYSEIRQQVVDIALQHHLVSKYTSLVAVDTTPTRPLNASSADAAMKVQLPKGWNHTKVFGKLPATATPSRLRILTGVALLLAAILLWMFRAGLRPLQPKL